MEFATILRTATILLAIAAVGGLIMAGIRFAGDRQPPVALAMLHGSLAAAAVTLLLYGAVTIGLPSMALGALALFLLAAVGGAILNLNYHWQQRPLPNWLVLVHGLVAVAGFLLLLSATWATRSP